MNKVMLIGVLNRDPEMNYTEQGLAVTRLSLLASWPSKMRGVREKETGQFDILTWGELAELCSRLLNKDDNVSVEGYLRIRKYRDRGSWRIIADIMAYSVELMVDDISYSERRFFGDTIDASELSLHAQRIAFGEIDLSLETAADAFNEEA
jgi:single-strand DNA-binding protein